MTTAKRWLPEALIVLCAVAFIVAMIISGALPTQRQLVKFEAKGVMQAAPEEITRVEIRLGTRSAMLVRTSAQAPWARENDGRVLDESDAQHLSMAVQMMNTSAPVRVMSVEDLDGVDRTPFGLEPLALSAVLYRADAPVLTARFGGLNPEGYLQYMALEGRPEVFLMSRFVGEQWQQAAQALIES